MLELAADCALPPDAAGYVEAAAQSGNHLRFLIDAVLEFQRMEVGAMQLRRVPLSLRAVLRTAMRIDRHAHLVLNLLSNAVKYSNSGAIRVRAGLVPLSPEAVEALGEGGEGPGGSGGDALCVRFEVEDSGCRGAEAAGARRARARARTRYRISIKPYGAKRPGPGIAPASVARLFSPFFRAHSDMATDPGGNGLGILIPAPFLYPAGLAISKEIVNAAGGEIGCDAYTRSTSQVGRGSTFFFSWPFRAAPPGSPGPGPPAFSSSSSFPPSPPASALSLSAVGVGARADSWGVQPTSPPASAAAGGSEEAGGPRVLIAEDDEVRAPGRDGTGRDGTGPGGRT
eukprot:tig00020629_g12447.t1